ncbi:hypothetical protein A5722_02365 [Mycobacterium vulneris]|nr:hypothetical protein A5722_02365 [Mycolicibacterium vulneris]OCB67257.1 hypothetical protein A5729_07970 [Mycolicibacterium vulneris]
MDLYVLVFDQGNTLVEQTKNAIEVLKRLPEQVALDPIHPNATPGQKLFYFKRIASEMTPIADDFERTAKTAEETGRLLNKTLLEMVDILATPELQFAATMPENIDQFRELPSRLSKSFGGYDKFKSQMSALGRMSRDLRIPISSIERGFDSLDVIIELMRDWQIRLAGFGKANSESVATSKN